MANDITGEKNFWKSLPEDCSTNFVGNTRTNHKEEKRCDLCDKPIKSGVICPKCSSPSPKELATKRQMLNEAARVVRRKGI